MSAGTVQASMENKQSHQVLVVSSPLRVSSFLFKHFVTWTCWRRRRCYGQETHITKHNLSCHVVLKQLKRAEKKCRSPVESWKLKLWPEVHSKAADVWQEKQRNYKNTTIIVPFFSSNELATQPGLTRPLQERVKEEVMPENWRRQSQS